MAYQFISPFIIFTSTKTTPYYMESKISFNTPKVARLNTVIPQAVIAGNMVFVSGTAGINPETGKLIDGGIEEQAMQAFFNIQTILTEAGSSLDIFMVHGEDSDFSKINRVYAHFFPDSPPARSAPQVLPFPGGSILVSIECIAVI
jgi:2-iminobutanoate/2-iminopropanoate deaminase